MASGPEEALAKVAAVLEAMSTAAGNKNLHFVRKCDLEIPTPTPTVALPSRSSPVVNVTLTRPVAGGLGTASAVKLVNNHLAGVHLAAAAEGFAFAKKKNMNLKTVYEVLAGGAASTYVLIDRKSLHLPLICLSSTAVFPAERSIERSEQIG